MGKTRVRRWAWGAASALLSLAGPAAASGPSRFASYAAEADCVAARTLSPAVCHTAFARARAEYEAKTPSFASQALCTRRYASCMAWPPGDRSGGRAGGTAFRPLWDGVDIVDTPTEHSVTPAPGSTGRAVRFAARSLDAEPAPLVIRGAGLPVPPRRIGPAPVGRPAPAPAVAARLGAPGAAPLARMGAPPPGSGFKLEDGVLTYPAPARFQPRNLPKP